MICVFRVCHRSCKSHLFVIWAMISGEGKKQRFCVVFSISMCEIKNGENQSIKFRSVPVGTAGIFRSVSKTGTEHDIKNFVLCTVLFRPE